MRLRAPFTSNDITVGGAGSTVDAAGKLVVASTAAITDNTVTTSTLTGNATLGGDIVADANEAKSIFATTSPSEEEAARSLQQGN